MATKKRKTTSKKGLKTTAVVMDYTQDLKNALSNWQGEFSAWAKDLQKNGEKSAQNLKKDFKKQTQKWQKNLKNWDWKAKTTDRVENVIKRVRQNVSSQVDRIQDWDVFGKTFSALNIPTQNEMKSLKRKISRLEKQVRNMK